MVVASPPVIEQDGQTETLGVDLSNDASEMISLEIPYRVSFTLRESAALLFHRWSCEAVEAKAVAAKGSKAKKTDDVETYIYRMMDGQIALPGEYVRQAVIHAAKFRQDPRSPRKSAMDLYKAAIVSLTELAPITNAAGKAADTWDYLDQRRVVVQRAGITRARPAFIAGWKVEVDFMVNLPEYVRPLDLHEVLAQAGRLIGVGDFRPTYGRFVVDHFEEEALLLAPSELTYEQRVFLCSFCLTPSILSGRAWHRGGTYPAT
jgi:hypothetical protein